MSETEGETEKVTCLYPGWAAMQGNAAPPQ